MTKEHCLTIDAHEAKTRAAGKLSLLLRPVEPQPTGQDALGHVYRDTGEVSYGRPVAELVRPLYKAGDVLLLRESWQYNPYGGIVYRAGSGIVDCDGLGWRAPVTMPKWAVRFRPRVKAVAVKRIHAMTEPEVEAAGHELVPFELDRRTGAPEGPCIAAFGQWWNGRYGDKYPWESNPFCWTIELQG